MASLVRDFGQRRAKPGSSPAHSAEMAGVVGRNSSLFAPLRPHPSRIAILWSLTGTPDSAMNAYQALFDTNIQVDFVHPDELVSGTAPYVVLTYPTRQVQHRLRRRRCPRSRPAAARSSSNDPAIPRSTLSTTCSTVMRGRGQTMRCRQRERPGEPAKAPRNLVCRWRLMEADACSWCHLPPRRRERRWHVRGR